MFLVPPVVCRRPDLNSKRRLLTSFCFVNFLKVFVCSCVSVPRQGSRCSSSRPSLLQVGVGVRHMCRESAGRESLKSAAVCSSLKPAVRGDINAAVRGTLKPAFHGEITAAVRGSKVKFAGCVSLKPPAAALSSPPSAVLSSTPPSAAHSSPPAAADSSPPPSAAPSSLPSAGKSTPLSAAHPRPPADAPSSLPAVPMSSLPAAAPSCPPAVPMSSLPSAALSSPPSVLKSSPPAAPTSGLLAAAHFSSGGSSSPVPARSAVLMSCIVLRNSFNLPCLVGLVHGDSSASPVVDMEAVAERIL